MNKFIAKFNSYIFKVTQHFNLRDSDVFIASYPRSGNTWLRYLIADAILQLNNYETDTILPINVDKIIPDLHVHDLKKHKVIFNMPHRLIKTHQNYSKIKNHKTICLFRSPADVLCSYFHFHRRYKHLYGKTLLGIDRFCVGYIDDWSKHIKSYINGYKKGKILFVSYEELHSDTLNTLKKFFQFYGLDVDDEIILKSISNHEFSKKRKNEKISTSHKNEYFFRKGKISSSSAELNPETIALINKKSQEFYQEAISIEESEA